jgi:hypothetical protein
LRFRANSISLAEFDLLRDCRDSDRHMACWNRPEHNSIGTDPAVIPDLDFAEYFRSRTDHNPIADSRRPTPTSAVSEGYLVINRASFTDNGFGMQNDPTEMMQSQASANPCLHGDGNSRSDFNHPLREKPERLRRNAALV